MTKVSSSNGLEKCPKLRFTGFTYEWQSISMFDVGDIITGATPSTNVADFYGNEYLWVTPTDIDGKEIKSTLKKLTKRGLAAGRLVPANSVLVTCIASIGKNTILRTIGSCNQQINAITPYTSYNLDFLYYNICFNEPKLHNAAGRGGMEILNKISFSQIKMNFPDLAEQKKIADFMSLIDQRIEKQQQLLELLKKYKKGISNEVFREIHLNENNEKMMFSDTYELVQHNTFSRELLTTTPTEICNIHYGDILVKYNSVLDLQANTIPYIKEDVDVSKYSSNSYLRNGDIIFADTAEDYTVGKVVEITNVKEEKILSGLHTIPCRPKINISMGYMGHYLNSKEFRLQILPLIQGTKVSSINKTELMKTQIVLPSIEKQKKISDIFNNFDTKIKIETKKLNYLQKMKKGLLQQLFI